MKFLKFLVIACFFSFIAGVSVSSDADESILLPTMVKIPAGTVKTYTCPGGGTICPDDDRVKKMVKIAGFELAATPVTFAQWDQCVADGGCLSQSNGWAYLERPVKPPCVAGQSCQYPDDEGWGRGNRPVVNVSWDDAQHYLQWLNKKTAEKYRLPTTEEWRYAALAGQSGIYYWGKSIGKNHTNCDGCGSRWDNKQTAPVASFKPNQFGLYDMLGNVNQWVVNCFPTREQGSQTCAEYMLLGGAWTTEAASIGVDRYNHSDGSTRMNMIGLRVAKSVD